MCLRVKCNTAIEEHLLLAVFKHVVFNSFHLQYNSRFGFGFVWVKFLFCFSLVEVFKIILSPNTGISVCSFIVYEILGIFFCINVFMVEFCWCLWILTMRAICLMKWLFKQCYALFELIIWFYILDFLNFFVLSDARFILE